MRTFRSIAAMLCVFIVLYGPSSMWLAFSIPEPVRTIVSETGPKETHAESGYVPTSIAVTQGKEITDMNYAAVSNGTISTGAGAHWRIMSTTSGIDATMTFEDVELHSANVLYINYDGSVSSSSLTYQIQIWDETDQVWRSVLPHETNLSNTTESGAGLVTQATAAVNNGYQFPIYDGYFSNGSNTPVSTPLSHFVNASKQVKVRFYSTVSTANYELRVDYLGIEPTIDNMRYASSLSFGSNGGSISGGGEYNDTTTDDASGVVITAGSSGIDAQFSFTNLPTPYTGANTILVEFSGNKDASLTNYYVYIKNYSATWDVLNATALTNTSDGKYEFATDQAQFANYISGNTAVIQIYSSDSSGTATVDHLRMTIGSTTTSAGIYNGTISRGGTATGTPANTTTLDTTTAASSWVIPTTTVDTRTTTEYYGDCGTATNSCTASNIVMPVTVPDNHLVTGVHMAWRYITSVATVDLEFGIRSKKMGNVPMSLATTDEIALHTMYRTAAYPMQPQVGNDPLATIPVYQPHEYVDTVNNAITVYARTAATTVATAQTMTWDFAFVSIKTIDVGQSITAAWTPTDGSLTYGTSTNSNYRFTRSDDNGYWVITRNGTSGTDATLSFIGISIPTGANKLIITTKLAWSVVSTAYELYLYDFNSSSWREITPHSTNFVAYTTANTEQIVQLEIYDGYFSNGSNTPVDTPLSYFVSSGEARIRVVSASTTANASIDYASLEFVKDPVYFPASVSTTGTVTAGTEYNDLTTDDATSNFVVTYSGGLQASFTFDNVLTPPTGSNALYVVYSGYRTTITNYSVKVRNYGGGSCTAGYESLNGTALTNTSDGTYYFLYAISDWSCYISGGQMEIQVTTTGSSGSINIDFLKIALGSVNTASNTSSIDMGAVYKNDVSKIRTMDTSATFNGLLNGWRVKTVPNTMNNRQYDAPTTVSGRVEMPLTMPSNSYPISLIYMYAGTPYTTAITVMPTFRDAKNYYADAMTYKATIAANTAAGMPRAVDTITNAIATYTVREGWYGTNTLTTAAVTAMPNVPNALNTVDNTVEFRYRTSASTAFTSSIFDLDGVFVALRYVE